MAYGRERVPQILLVEDDEGDALLTEKALSKGPIPFDLHHVETGADALAFLEAWAPRPDLILLDLNLPGMHGTEVLTAAKEHPEWRRIPVVILTSSKAEADILQSYNLHANAYMVKPGTPAIFETITADLGRFYFEAAELAQR